MAQPMTQDRNQNRNNSQNTSSHGKSRRGFAAMSKEKQREIARKGGKASHGGGRPRSTPR